MGTDVSVSVRVTVRAYDMCEHGHAGRSWHEHQGARADGDGDVGAGMCVDAGCRCESGRGCERRCKDVVLAALLYV